MTLDDTIFTVQESMRESGATSELIAAVVKTLRKTAAEEKASRDNAPKKAKTQFVALKLRSEESTSANGDHLGWILQLEESASPVVAYHRVIAAANAFNSSKKGRRVPVKTLGQALENVPARFYKTTNPTEVTRVKTRVAVAIMTIASNDLPK
jgi:hypothetical protein